MSQPAITPSTILESWFGDAPQDPALAAARNPMWFGSSPEADTRIREQFVAAIDAAARGELAAWAEAPRSSLALVLLLDQFPRNIWRGTAAAFAQDAQAREVARGAVAAGFLEQLAPIEQAFLTLPLQHSESLADQRESVRLCTQIVAMAPPEWRPLLEQYLPFAQQHLELIERFGRFPHRNHVLGRVSTPAERAYLDAGGATFGQPSGPGPHAATNHERD